MRFDIPRGRSKRGPGPAQPESRRYRRAARRLERAGWAKFRRSRRKEYAAVHNEWYTPRDQTRMWCGDTKRHLPHSWGDRNQHFCRGKGVGGQGPPKDYE